MWFIKAKLGEECDLCPLAPLLGAPVCWGFHQGLGDDSRCLLCPASMEATKPQERKRTILRRVAVVVKQYPTLLGEFHFAFTISPKLTDMKIYLYLWAAVCGYAIFV